MRLLGRTIIKEVSIFKDYKKEPLEKLKAAIESGGGPGNSRKF